MSKNQPSKKRTRTKDTRPADVIFGERLATEFKHWEYRHDQVRKIAYSRAAKGAKQDQINAALEWLQREMEATLTALRTIPERQQLAGVTTPDDKPQGPFAVPGLGVAKTAPPKKA